MGRWMRGTGSRERGMGQRKPRIHFEERKKPRIPSCAFVTFVAGGE